MTARAGSARAIILAGSICVVSASCSTAPVGPQVMVLPGSDKTLAQFEADDSACRRWAAQRIGATPSEAADTPSAPNAATAPAAGPSPEIVAGSTIGAGSGERARWSTQDRYDVAYMQCMYASGNQIPVPRSFGEIGGRDTATVVDDVPSGIPPPPDGDPPPPPPGEVR